MSAFRRTVVVRQPVARGVLWQAVASGWAGPIENLFKGWLMLWTVFLVLIVLWMLGVVSSYTLGGFIHVLLVLAVIALVIQLIQGRRVV